MAAVRMGVADAVRAVQAAMVGALLGTETAPRVLPRAIAGSASRMTLPVRNDPAGALRDLEIRRRSMGAPPGPSSLDGVLRSIRTDHAGMAGDPPGIGRLPQTA